MPSPKGYIRNYKQEAATESEARKKARADRNASRRKLIKEGLVHRNDGRQVDHIQPLSKGGSGRSRSNLRVRSQKANSSFQRNSKGKMKYEDQR